MTVERAAANIDTVVMRRKRLYLKRPSRKADILRYHCPRRLMASLPRLTFHSTSHFDPPGPGAS